MESVISAAITGCLSLIGVVIAGVSGSRVTSYKIDELKQDTSERIRDLKDDFAHLREKVEKHNNLVERVAIVEQSTKSAHHRIDEMKGGS